MEFKGSEVCKPDEGIEVIAKDEVHLAVGSLCKASKYIDIIRCPLRGIFLVKIFSSYPIRVTVHGKRPVMEKRKHTRGHFDIVGNDLLLGDRERRKHDFVKIGQVDPGEIPE
jgi:hypothetical protein